MSILRRIRARRSQDGGFTLVEMLVAIIVLGSLGTVFLSTVLGAQGSANATSTQQDLNEEARLALNRMARELRQADSLTSVQNPDGASYDADAITSITFTADFDGDGCIDGVAPTPTPSPAPTCNSYSSSNPETLTYCWDPSASVRQLYLIPGAMAAGSGCQTSGALPILAGQVTSFKLSYRSNEYLYDTEGNPDGSSDGITTWTELDEAGSPVGDNNGQLNAIELANTDSVVIDLSVSQAGAHAQSYVTQVDLRNLS